MSEQDSRAQHSGRDLIRAEIDSHPLHPIQIGPCRFQRRRRRRRRPPTSHHQSRSRIRQRNQSRNLLHRGEEDAIAADAPPPLWPFRR